MRPPRIMVIGRSGSGKSSLINAICGLKVAEVSDTDPQTGMADWKEYYHQGSELIHLLDTRGLQEAKLPKEYDDVKTPEESIIIAIRKNCPDVILLVADATTRAAIDVDLNICEAVLKEIYKRYYRELPIIGVLTKCDLLPPPKICILPTDNERKNRNIEEQVENFRNYFCQKDSIRRNLKKVIPTATYAEYNEYGEIIEGEDYRWNIDRIVEILVEQLPGESQSSLVRMGQIKRFQKTVARTVVTSCVALCGIAGGSPIPGTAIPIIGSIQAFMIMYIAYVGGREFSEETVTDFFIATGVGIGANAGLAAIASELIKLIPGYGHVIAGATAATATQGIGDAAISFFIDKSPVEQVQEKLNWEKP